MDVNGSQQGHGSVWTHLESCWGTVCGASAAAHVTQPYRPSQIHSLSSQPERAGAVIQVQQTSGRSKFESMWGGGPPYHAQLSSSRTFSRVTAPRTSPRTPRTSTAIASRSITPGQCAGIVLWKFQVDSTHQLEVCTGGAVQLHAVLLFGSTARQWTSASADAMMLGGHRAECTSVHLQG